MKYYAKAFGREWVFTFERRGRIVRAFDGERTREVDLAHVADGALFALLVDGECYDCLVEREQRRSIVQLLGERIVVEVEDQRERTASRVASVRSRGRWTIEAAMPGIVVDVQVAVGDTVVPDQTLLVVEAMKMQNPIRADGAGTVVRLDVGAGQAVAAGQVLVELDASDASDGASA